MRFSIFSSQSVSYQYSYLSARFRNDREGQAIVFCSPRLVTGQHIR
jgi:hypothetical protein